MPHPVANPHASDGPPDGRGLKVAVVTAGWHPAVIANLRSAALRCLEACGVAGEDLLSVDVAGSFELPQAATWIARAGLADAIVLLGCLVRGETPHFDLIATAVTDGAMRAAQETGIPVALGVITADTLAQAEARSRPDGGVGKGGNKGEEAADAAVRLALAYRRLEDRRRR
jgi:6,7-dimethyl-8-ribityllumazine synthase